MNESTPLFARYPRHIIFAWLCSLSLLPMDGHAQQQDLSANSDGIATVTIDRVRGFAGSGIVITVSVDGEEVGALGRRDSVSFSVTPGLHVLSTLHDPDNQKGLGRALVNTEAFPRQDIVFDFEPNRRYSFVTELWVQGEGLFGRTMSAALYEVDPDPIDDNDSLSSAISDEKYDRAMRLIEDGIGVHYRNADGTPLHVAIGKQRIELVEALLSAGVDVNKKNGAGRTALSHALHVDWIDCVERILAHDTELEWIGSSGTVMHDLLESPYSYLISDMLSQGADPNALDINQRSLLATALQHARIDAATALIEAGAGAGDEATAARVMVESIANACVECVELLLSNGSSANLILDNGLTLLDVAYLLPVGRNRDTFTTLLAGVGAESEMEEICEATENMEAFPLNEIPWSFYGPLRGGYGVVAATRSGEALRLQIGYHISPTILGRFQIDSDSQRVVRDTSAISVIRNSDPLTNARLVGWDGFVNSDPVDRLLWDAYWREAKRVPDVSWPAIPGAVTIGVFEYESDSLVSVTYPQDSPCIELQL